MPGTNLDIAGVYGQVERQVALDVGTEHHALAAAALALAPVGEHLHGGEAGAPSSLVDRREAVVTEAARTHPEVVQLTGRDRQTHMFGEEGRVRAAMLRCACMRLLVI